MKTSALWAALSLSAAICWATNTAAADEPFQAELGVGFLMATCSDNLDPDGSGKILKGLGAPDGHEQTVTAFVVPRLTYDIGAPGAMAIQFYVKPPVEEAGGLVLNFGGSYEVAGGGVVAGGVFVAPLEEAWEDPYLVGSRRSTTDNVKYGLHASWQDIAGSGFGLGAVLFRDGVEDDRSGARFADLDRDGTAAYAIADYRYALSETIEIQPQLRYGRGDYDGASNSYHRYRASVGLQYRSGRMMVMPRVYYQFTDYDRMDPVFHAYREERGFGVDLVVVRIAPFGCDRWTAQVQTGYRQGADQIDFYDTESLHGGVILSYRF